MLNDPGYFYVKSSAGSHEQPMNLWLSTTEFEFGLFTTDCNKDKCLVPKPFKTKDSYTFNSSKDQ